MNDVGVIEAARHRQLLLGRIETGLGPHEQAVDAVVGQHVVLDVWTDTAIIGREGFGLLKTRRLVAGLFEAVWRSAHGGAGVAGQPVEGDVRAEIDHLNRIHGLLYRLDQHIAAAAEADIGMVDGLQENPFVFQVKTP